MLTVEERFMIKHLHREGVSLSETARRTGHDRKTVRQVVDEPVVPDHQVHERQRHKLGPYVAYLEQRIAEGVLNANKLYSEIQVQGYTGSRSQLRAFIHPMRPDRVGQATVRFETQPGQQAQADWAHFGLIDHHGHQRRLYAFLMTLSWSRMLYVEFTVSADTAWWLRGHQHAFAYFGGVPREVLHDNLKSAVLNRDSDGTVHWNPRYLDFADYYGFVPHACQPYRAQTKGKVERGVKYLRNNFWNGLRFSDLTDLNRQAWEWLDRTANVRVHGTTHEVPLARLPLEGLQPILGKPAYDTSLVSSRRSTKDCQISYNGNFYSIPAGHHQQELLVKETERGDLVIFTPQGLEIARHTLASGYNQRIVDPAHYQTITSLTQRPSPNGAVQVSLPSPKLAAPTVEVRALSDYEQLLEGVGHE